MEKQWKQCQTLFFGGSKITADRAPLHPSQSGHPTDTAGWDSAVRVDAPSAQVATFVYSPSTFLSWGLEDATQCY